MGRADRLWPVLALGVFGVLQGCGTSTRAAPVVISGERAAVGRAGETVAEPSSPDMPAEPEPTVAATPPVSPARPRGDFAAYLGDLRSASCVSGAWASEAEEIGFSAQAITLGRLGVRRQMAGRLRYAGGFELSSSDPRFGGLSGLEVLPDGNLLSVSDQGDFVWIDLAEDGLTPVGARVAPMRDERGETLTGKADGDAEGLAVQDGLALVSFERNHRILAFDLRTCGADARGVDVVRGGSGGALGASFDAAGLSVTSNAGPEPLAVTSDWYVFVGTETLSDGRGPLSARPLEAAAQFDLTIENGAPAFVGMDLLEDGDLVRAFTLHRGFDSIAGNAIVISETVLERELDQAGLPARIVSEIDERSRYRYRMVSSRRLAELGAALNNVDNFEGIAVQTLEPDRVRILIVSDDNFSDRQRTLLMAFDLMQ